MQVFPSILKPELLLEIDKDMVYSSSLESLEVFIFFQI